MRILLLVIASMAGVGVIVLIFLAWHYYSEAIRQSNRAKTAPAREARWPKSDKADSDTASSNDVAEETIKPSSNGVSKQTEPND